MEQMLEKRIIGAMHGLKNGTKTPQDVALWLNKLKKVNVFLYEDYFNKYKDLVVKTN
jgi:hypothetical protein